MGSVNDIERKQTAVEAELAHFVGERDRLIEKLRTLRAEKAAFLQAAGRSRPSEAKNTPTLFDVREPMLARMHDRRRAGYKALGYEIIEPSSVPAQLALDDM